MAPQAVELCDFNALMGSFKLVSPYSLHLAESTGDNIRHDFCRVGNRRFASIQEEEEEEEEDQHVAMAGKHETYTDGSMLLPSSSSSSLSSLSTPHSQGVSCLSASAVSSVSPVTTNRQIMKCMCSSALILFSVTALLLLLPLVLPPLPPPPSELMLLPVAILLLLICAALSPRPMPSPPSAASGSVQYQAIPLLPLAHSLPLRSSMPL